VGGEYLVGGGGDYVACCGERYQVVLYVCIVDSGCCELHVVSVETIGLWGCRIEFFSRNMRFR